MVFICEHISNGIQIDDSVGIEIVFRLQGTRVYRKGSRRGSLEHDNSNVWALAYITTEAALADALGLLTYLK